ncbi:MAG TPA: ComEC/Rec2 family competence protein [Anaerolineales bacterium]|nr:ComEC/Rec2 family competence protein [Anaerolineales bacterium]
MPLFWISLAFLSGILLAREISIPMLIWGVLACLAILFSLPPIYRRINYSPPRRVSIALKIPSPRLYPFMILCVCLGTIRYQLEVPITGPAFISYYNDRPGETVVEGMVDGDPDIRDTYANLRVKISSLQMAGDSQTIYVHGLLLARVPAGTSFSYGDRIRLQGKIQTPAENEDFSYRDYLANQGIYSYLPYPTITLIQSNQGNPVKSVLYGLRERAVKTVYTLFPDPEASLLSGILLGVQGGISAKLQEAFRQTGTSHIIVISGFNITIISGLFTYLFSRIFGRYKGAIFAALGIIIYTLFVGAGAAVVRAAILGLLSVLGHLIGRRQTGLNSLTFGAGLMAIVTPSVLWDVSFQLSFAATLGIMLYAEPMSEWFIKILSRIIPQEQAQKLAGPVGDYFLVTLAAQITTLPLMMYYFKRLSLTAMIANPLILPAQPAIMVLGGLAVLIGMVLQPMGQLLAWMAWPFTAYTIRMVEWLANIPHGSIALGQVALPIILLFYSGLLIITLARTQVKRLAAKLTLAVPLTILGIAAVFTWKAAFDAPDGLLHVTILDVGTGEGVLIQSPTGREILINGGASTNRLSDALGRRLPSFDRSLDWLVVADIDEEDLAGVASNMERFTSGNVLWAGKPSGTRAAGEVWTEIGSLSIPTNMMQPGQSLDLGEGARLSAVEVNNKGAVLFLEWGNFRMLLPMGMDVNALDSLQGNSAIRNISALLLAESGYAPVNPAELITHLNPQVVLLSVSAADKSGLPSPETIQALGGYNLVRTDQSGWIEISTDGSQMWVAVERR